MRKPFQIIPAIDLIDGKCVRLSQGDFNAKTIYSDSPLEVAKRFEDAGLKRLHMVDLDGARAGQICNLAVLESVATGTSLEIDFSGGIKNENDVSSVFSAGAAMIAIGSLATKDPARITDWVAKFGDTRILIGADVRDGLIAINGWETKTDLMLLPFIEDMVERGVRQIFVTDVSKDGLLSGPATELYEQIIAKFDDLQLIASGGVTGIDDLHRLNEIGCAGAIIGKALYEGRIDLENLVKEFGD